MILRCAWVHKTEIKYSIDRGSHKFYDPKNIGKIVFSMPNTHKNQGQFISIAINWCLHGNEKLFSVEYIPWQWNALNMSLNTLFYYSYLFTRRIEFCYLTSKMKNVLGKKNVYSVFKYSNIHRIRKDNIRVYKLIVLVDTRLRSLFLLIIMDWI